VKYKYSEFTLTAFTVMVDHVHMHRG